MMFIKHRDNCQGEKISKADAFSELCFHVDRGRNFCGMCEDSVLFEVLGDPSFPLGCQV